MATEKKLYGWYSAEADASSRHIDYTTPEGSIIQVTYVDSKPPPQRIKPNTPHRPKGYMWDDTVFRGEITDIKGICLMNEMESCIEDDLIGDLISKHE